MKKVYLNFRHLSIGIYRFSQEDFTVIYIFRQEITKWRWLVIYRICTVILCLSLIIPAFSGGYEGLAGGLSEGIASAWELVMSLSGGMCLWCGVCEIMGKAGLTERLSRLFAPVINRLFKTATDREFKILVSQNISANFLGLGNLATVSGLKAAKILADKGQTNLLGRLIVFNTASIQLLPTSLCTIRASLGAVNAYDILPHVWISSVISVCVGVFVCIMSERGEKS